MTKFSRWHVSSYFKMAPSCKIFAAKNNRTQVWEGWKYVNWSRSCFKLINIRLYSMINWNYTWMDGSMWESVCTLYMTGLYLAQIGHTIECNEVNVTLNMRRISREGFCCAHTRLHVSAYNIHTPPLWLPLDTHIYLDMLPTWATTTNRTNQYNSAEFVKNVDEICSALMSFGIYSGSSSRHRSIANGSSRVRMGSIT